MRTVKRIRLADNELAEIQDSKSAVHVDLQKMESVANVAEAMWDRSHRVMGIALGLIGGSLLALFWSIQRAWGEDSSWR